MESVERRKNLSTAELEDEYVAKGRPVVLTDLVDGWPAITRWSPPSELGRLAGELMAPLITLPPGNSYYGSVDPVETPFATCLERIFGGGGGRHYISQIPLLELAPQLASDFAFPFPDLDAVHEPVFFWIGTGGCVSNVHFDFAHNFACQISGRKRFRLYPPEQSHRLYPSLTSKFSPVSTLGDTSLDEYPLFARAKLIEVTLDPGSLLFLPSFWWHQVITDVPGVMISRFWNTASMLRDRDRLDACAMAILQRDFELALESVAQCETESYRDVLYAAAAREALAAPAASLARQALSRISNRRFVDEMAELFEGA
ncbi:MAG: hypothetical protein RL685_533 [Pseudomonadota bacterium]|jgi:lysine-specific demethylase 8